MLLGKLLIVLEAVLGDPHLVEKGVQCASGHWFLCLSFGTTTHLACGCLHCHRYKLCCCHHPCRKTLQTLLSAWPFSHIFPSLVTHNTPWNQEKGDEVHQTYNEVGSHVETRSCENLLFQPPCQLTCYLHLKATTHLQVSATSIAIVTSDATGHLVQRNKMRPVRIFITTHKC